MSDTTTLPEYPYRAIQILEFVNGQEPHAVNCTEVAQRLGIERKTAQQYLRDLARWGVICEEWDLHDCRRKRYRSLLSGGK
jgi:DNA-binding IclR family transcriptional regulator